MVNKNCSLEDLAQISLLWYLIHFKERFHIKIISKFRRIVFSFASVKCPRFHVNANLYLSYIQYRADRTAVEFCNDANNPTGPSYWLPCRQIEQSFIIASPCSSSSPSRLFTNISLHLGLLLKKYRDQGQANNAACEVIRMRGGWVFEYFRHSAPPLSSLQLS